MPLASTSLRRATGDCPRGTNTGGDFHPLVSDRARLSEAFALFAGGFDELREKPDRNLLETGSRGTRLSVCRLKRHFPG